MMNAHPTVLAQQVPVLERYRAMAIPAR